jgi:hypothetical protein
MIASLKTYKQMLLEAADKRADVTRNQETKKPRNQITSINMSINR